MKTQKKELPGDAIRQKLIDKGFIKPNQLPVESVICEQCEIPFEVAGIHKYDRFCGTCEAQRRYEKRISRQQQGAVQTGG